MKRPTRNASSRPKRKTFYQKKICRFCADAIDVIDYKDVKLIKNLLTDRGKIIPSRISGNCSRHQRKLTVAIKRARHMALVPFTIS